MIITLILDWMYERSASVLTFHNLFWCDGCAVENTHFDLMLNTPRQWKCFSRTKQNYGLLALQERCNDWFYLELWILKSWQPLETCPGVVDIQNETLEDLGDH